MNNISTILETVFLEKWNTVALICEGGEIHIKLVMGRFFKKDKAREGLGTGWSEEYYKQIEDLFDELYTYYCGKYLSLDADTVIALNYLYENGGDLNYGAGVLPVSISNLANKEHENVLKKVMNHQYKNWLKSKS